MNHFWTAVRWTILAYVTAAVLFGLLAATLLALPVIAAERLVLRLVRRRVRVA